MSDNPAHRLIRVRALIELALPNLDALPPVQRADVFEGIADVTRDLDPEMNAMALRIASQLRDAELQQLNFRNLFAES